MLIIRQALICDALSHLSFAVVIGRTHYVIFPLLSRCRIYHNPTIPQLIWWQPSPGAWNVNKTRNENDVHCSS
ncbi:hypothetical protein N326_02027 [Eurypyga helias]|uniref:Secreted protein n=1 Tax=Eurypyga helias TaxID=54383 RepID=A0A093IN37_EURHL|nr:hypothetical protein N326_02027 [Eurypyga helias]